MSESTIDFLPNYPLTASMRDVLRRMSRANRSHLHELTPADARAAYEAGAGVLEIPKLSLEKVEDFTITARDGYAIPARLYTAKCDKLLPTLIYFHGGGFTVGSIETHDHLCRSLALRAGCAVISLDYRLAPEYPFPMASDDAWDALCWISSHGGARSLDTRRIAVGGDSAGGTLAAVCAILARDAGLKLALQLLIYPGATAYQDTPSHEAFAHGLILEKEGIAWFFEKYVRSPSDREDWRFAPLLAPDVEGVAPAWVGLAELDPLVDEGVMYADKLRMAGVPVELEIYRGVTHEFIKMGRVIPEAIVAQADAALALRRAFELI